MLTHPVNVWLICTDLGTGNGHRTKMSPRNPNVPLVQSQYHIIYPTNPRGALDDCIEHRLHVRRRAADDAEHLGCCCLMLQGFPQFRVAFLYLFEQSYILDGDYRLICKCLEERYLLLGERIDYRTSNKNGPNWNLFAQEWHSKYGSITFSFGGSPELRKLSRGYGQQILYVDYLTVDHCPATR